ncbi:MAG: hypothetical protein CMJ40_04050 [Phycisphaerae bacterium]|nr:hypothetical protein [Phycisphaerae bacterium]
MRMRFLCLFIAMVMMPVLELKAEVIQVPDDHPTIQQAIDASDDGDVIEIASGTYNEIGITTDGKGITIRGHLDIDGVPTTIIDGQHQGILMNFSFEDGNDTRIEDLLFTRGGTDEYAAVVLFHARPIFTNCHFVENGTSTGIRFGGGVYNLNGAPQFHDCRFIDNQARWGGGYATWETGQPDHPVFIDCEFIGNMAQLGGAMTNMRSQPLISDCVFRNNLALQNGGALYNDGSDCCPHWNGSFTLRNCLIEENIAGESGGGLYNGFFGLPMIEDCTIRANMATSSGSGIASEIDMNPTLMANTICSNSGTADQISGNWTDGGDNDVLDACPECTGDLDGSGMVDVNDLLTQLAAYGNNDQGDCDADGDTDVNDLLMLIEAWGDCQ